MNRAAQVIKFRFSPGPGIIQREDKKKGSTKQKYRETVVNEERKEKKKKFVPVPPAWKMFALRAGSLEPFPRMVLLG